MTGGNNMSPGVHECDVSEWHKFVIAIVTLNRVYTPCARMHWQLAQMSTLAFACASPLHSASFAMDKSINMQAYVSVYIRICPYAEQRVCPRCPWSAFVIGWNASAGLRWPWKFKMFELWRRQSAYGLGTTGDRNTNSYADSRHMHAYMRAWSINPTLVFPEPGDWWGVTPKLHQLTEVSLVQLPQRRI